MEFNAIQNLPIRLSHFVQFNGLTGNLLLLIGEASSSGPLPEHTGPAGVDSRQADEFQKVEPIHFCRTP